jgi:predicted Ser/Thr protein kinase
MRQDEMSVPTLNPFVPGSWVRGERFFGRERLLQEVLEGGRSAIWVLGTRRLGKTSFLKELESRCNGTHYCQRYIPLFWDLEGSSGSKGLRDSLLEAVDSGERRFQAIGVHLDELKPLEAVEILNILRRRAIGAGLTLMLLCDECEELIGVAESCPEVLPRLRRIFQEGENVRTVLASTRRLRRLDQLTAQTSPFLHGLVPPLVLRHLQDDEARSLIGRGEFDPVTTTEIMTKTGNHPFLLQLMCKRLFEFCDVDRAVQSIASDDMVAHFFSVDLGSLDADEKRLLMNVAGRRSVSAAELASQPNADEHQVSRLLYGLEQMGFVREDNGSYSMPNYFFERWLRAQRTPGQVPEPVEGASAGAASPSRDLHVEQAALAAALPVARFPAGSAAGALAGTPGTKVPMVGTSLGRFLVLEELGAGGMGVVFRARDARLGRDVAVKVLSAGRLADEASRKQFHKEAMALSRLNHPNIGTLHDFDIVDNVEFLVMEYVAGVTLAQRLALAPLDEKEIVRLGCQIAEALGEAHTHGVVHLDLNPRNILVTHAGQVKVLDFGLAKLLHPRPETETTETITELTSVAGTLPYMAPEQLVGKRVDARTDLYALGVVLYEIVTGQRPFWGKSAPILASEIVNKSPVPPGQLNPELSPKLGEVILKCLEKDPSARYQLAREVLVDLRRLQEPVSPRGDRRTSWTLRRIFGSR